MAYGVLSHVPSVGPRYPVVYQPSDNIGSGMLSAARSGPGRVTENTGDVGKLRKTANGTVSAGAGKRAAVAQMFYPELAKVGKFLWLSRLPCFGIIRLLIDYRRHLLYVLYPLKT